MPPFPLRHTSPCSPPFLILANPNIICSTTTGKSCLVDTALEHTAGIVSVRVAAGASEKEILANAFKAITRSNISFLDHSASAPLFLPPTCNGGAAGC